MAGRTAGHLLILWLAMLSGSACYAQGRFSQANPIGAAQFFAALKEVSLELKSDPSLAKFISVAEQQADIVRALAGHGITVRPNAPVTLLVTVTHRVPVIESRSATTGQVGDATAVQGIYILSEFFVKAVALRNGKLHLVGAAPAVGWAGSTLAEDSSLRKLLMGDQTRQDTRRRFVEIFGDSLQAIVPNPPAETPWIVNSWTEKATAAADAEYARLMGPGMPVEKSPLEGLKSTPEIYLTPHLNHDDCKADPGWNNSWVRVFQRLGWTGSPPPRVSLGHFFSCVYAYGLAAPRYFAVSDVIYLQQSDLVFELNGKPVRAWGELLTAHHEKFALEDTIKEVSADFIPRNIQDFLTDLVLGNGPDTRVIPSGTQSSGGGGASGGAGNRDAVPSNKGTGSTGAARVPARPATPPPPDDDPIGPGGFITPPTTAVNRSDQAKSPQWVRTDLPAFVEASKSGFAAYKKGDAQLSQGYKMWDSLIKPAPAKGCWVVQGTSSTTLSCLLLEQADLNSVRSYYTELNKAVTASLPREWKTQAAPPFGGDLPSQGYGSSSGAHLEVWIARAEGEAAYQVHFELVSAH